MGHIEQHKSLFFGEIVTLDKLQRLLRGAESHRSARMKVIPRLHCADGLTLSVQASDFHGCEPKNLTGPYSAVECALPSQKVNDLMPYLIPEEGISPEQGIYPFVPVSLVAKIINDHGGLVL